MPRNRSARNRDLPDNLYSSESSSAVYYRWRHPRTGEYKPLGKDRTLAVELARALNDALIRAGIDPRVRDINKTPSLSEVIKECRAKILSKYADNTRRNYGWHLDAIDAAIGSNPINMPLPVISSWFEDLADTSYIRRKKMLSEVYAYAFRKGYLGLTRTNPASVLESRKLPQPKRRRLTLPEFQAIYAQAPDWLQTAMDLMLRTTLRPGDIVNLQFSQLDGNRLLVQTSKTKARVAILFSGDEMSIIKRARQSGVVSKYIVHKLPDHRGRRRSGKDMTQLTVHALSRRFSDIRDGLGLGGAHPATLYEIRSLGSRLYEQMGRDRKAIQALLTHSSESMTDLYLEDRGGDFVEVQAGLKIN